MVLEILLTIAVLVASWMVYKKMGRDGWEGIVPFYNTYVLCEELYGNGWKFLFLLIPLYNIYFAFKLYIDWAHGFNKSTGFGIGMLFLPYVFMLILAFGDAQYGDGTKANNEADFVTKTADKAKEFADSVKKDDNAVEKIQQLKELRDQGVITEEEFEAKKEELLKKI